MNPENSSAALAQLQGIQQASQDPNTILSGQRQQLGVNAAQETVTGLRGAINNTTKLLKQVAPSVMGRTGSSLVTNAQATRQIGNEQAPIQQNLQDQGTQYNQAGEDLNRLQSEAEKAASGIYQGQQDKLSYAQNLYNTLYQKEQAAEAARQAELTRQEQIRQFNEELNQSRASTAAANRQFDLTRGDSLAATQQQAAAVPKAQDVQVAKQVNTLRQLGGMDLGTAIKGLREKARTGDALAKITAQKYYQSINKPIPFAEFR